MLLSRVSLSFDSLIMRYLSVDLFEFLAVYINGFHQICEVSDHYFFKYLSSPFSLLLLGLPLFVYWPTWWNSTGLEVSLTFLYLLVLCCYDLCGETLFSYCYLDIVSIRPLNIVKTADLKSLFRSSSNVWASSKQSLLLFFFFLSMDYILFLCISHSFFCWKLDILNNVTTLESRYSPPLTTIA